MRALLPSLLLLCVACGEDLTQDLDATTPNPDATTTPNPDATTTTPDAGPAPDAVFMPPDGAVDQSDPLFAHDHLTRVEIDLAPADWDALRAETRTLESTLARPECLDEPFASPFHYYPGRVRIDGVEYDPVGVRKKGFLGSLSDTKPSLKLKLDEYVPGADHLGLSKMAFNNGRQDPTLIKPCIGLDRMRAAGIPAPRCGYAEVIVNGTSLGPFVHVEEVSRRFIKRRFGDDSGQLYEGTLSDFRDGWTGTFEQELDEDVPYDRSDIDAVRDALNAPDASLLAALEPLIDLDAYYAFWASEVLIEHWDGYAGNTNNFYLYHRNDGRFAFIPWGVDGILGSQPTPPHSIYAEGLLARRLYLHPDARARYLAALRAQVDRWDSAAILGEVDRAAALIAPVVPAPDRAPVAAATEALRDFVRDRAAELRAELDVGGAAWTTPLRDRVCFELGAVHATLATRFGTHPSANVFLSGTGTFTATISEQRVVGVAVGGSSGFGTNPEDMTDAVILVAATLPDGSIPIFYAALDPTLLVDGAVIPFDGMRVRGALLNIPRPNAPIELVAGVWVGSITVLQGAATPNAPVVVDINVQLLRQR